MLNLTWRNLIQQRLRLAISIGGVALAVMLIQVMSGLFAGSEEHAVLYINSQPAPIWVMQRGVANMHMSSSILSSETVNRIQEIPGVSTAVGVLYASVGVEVGDAIIYSYVFGIGPDSSIGGPWSLSEGTANLAFNEIVIDRALAQRYGLLLGDTVNIMGYPLRIAGLSEGTFGIATNVTFVNKTAMASLMGVAPTAASYVLVQPMPQTDLSTVIQDIRTAVPEANVMTQNAFAESDQEMIRQMGADIIQIMTIVASIIGLLVIGITIYTTVLEHSREYGVLKAIGASYSQLLRVVFAQSFIIASAGFIVGIGLAYITASIVGRISPDILILIKPQAWLTQLPILILVTSIAVLLPIQRILRIDPLIVFKS